jgi:hypothetical protein
VIEVGGIETEFHAPARSDEIDPCARSEPGWPPLSAYNPAIIVVAVFAASTYTLIDCAVPVVEVLTENACADPAALES